MVGLTNATATVVYGAVLNGCCKAGLFKQAERVVEHLRSKGVWDSAQVAISHSSNSDVIEMLSPYICNEP